MPKYKLVVLTRPKAGREDDYNEWYQNVHLPEVLSIPGYLGAQRYKMHTPMLAKDPSPYVALYDLEADSLEPVLAESMRRAQNGEMTMSDAMDDDFTSAVYYEEFGPRVNSKS